jgi:hypothetical protein
MNTTLNSQLMKTTSEKAALEFQSELKVVAGEMQLTEKVTDGQIKLSDQLNGDYMSADEFFMMVLEANIIEDGIKQMEASEERMKELLDEA